jgi:hypothetical protein
VYIRNINKSGVKIVENHYDTILWLKLDKLFFFISLMLFILAAFMYGRLSHLHDVILFEDLFDS